MTTHVQTPDRVAVTTVADIVELCLPAYGDRAVVRYDDGARYRSVSGHEYRANVFKMVRFFRQHTSGREVVTTIMKNRPEWDMTALACLYTGNILSPLDTKMNDDELRRLLSDNPPTFVVVSRDQKQRLLQLLDELDQNPTVLIADLYPVYEDLGASCGECVNHSQILMSSLPEGSELLTASPLLEREHVVLARYSTSGTTSLPKVVSITHANILYQLREAMGMINLRKNEDVLSIGPYTHIATLLEFLVSRTKGFTVSYFTRDAEDEGVLEAEIKKLKRQHVRIRCLMAVPKFWTFVLKEILEEMNDKPVFKNLYRHLTSIEKSDHFYDIGSIDKAKLVAARTLLRNKLGGYFAYGISSSTKVEPGVIDIFAKLGITVIDVYGATEASGVIAKNELNLNRRGFCGKLLNGLEYKLKNRERVPGLAYEVGELYLSGPGIAAGYLSDTDRFELDEDDFLATGDIAYVDDNGWVFLVGRKKEQIRWEDGRYTDPMHVSNLLVRSIWIKDGLVVRRNTDAFLSAFLLPDHTRIEKSAHYRESIAKGLTPEQVIRPLLEDAIRYAQSLLGDFPVISTEKIYLLTSKLERTPTHKIKFISELARLDWERYV